MSARSEQEIWARKVAGGEIEQCKWVILACKRHFDDLDNSIERGIHFSHKDGNRIITFIEKLRHTKGEWAGNNFKLEPWQKFILWQIFGWKRADGTRRFRYAYIEIARKNGKTALSAGVGLYMLRADGEARPEVYSAATVKEQAKICFSDAVAIVKNTGLKNSLNVWTNSITYEEVGGTFKPLSSDYGTHDGLNPSCAIIDEFHAHKNSGMFDVLKSAMGARKQPLMFIITTAGDNKSGVCYNYRKNVMQVLQGVNRDESLFGIIFTLDEEEDWDNPRKWHLSNPNMGVSLSLKYLEEQVLDAKNRPEAVRNVKTKNLNLWVDAARTWILDEKWMRCVGEKRELERCTAWGGLDLSNVSDVTAYVLIFNENEKFQILPFFWIPQERMLEKIKNENVNYDYWVSCGFVNVTPGNIIDYDFVKSDILKINSKYNIQSCAYDRYNSSQIVIDLQNEGMNLTPMGQGFASLSAPTKEFERLVLSSQIEHFDNPVLRWMLNSTAISIDAAGNIKIDKQKCTQKVDGIAATIMAIGEWMTAFSKKNQNPYANRGLLE